MLQILPKRLSPLLKNLPPFVPHVFYGIRLSEIDCFLVSLYPEFIVFRSRLYPRYCLSCMMQHILHPYIEFYRSLKVSYIIYDTLKGIAHLNPNTNTSAAHVFRHYQPSQLSPSARNTPCASTTRHDQRTTRMWSCHMDPSRRVSLGHTCITCVSGIAVHK